MSSKCHNLKCVMIVMIKFCISVLLSFGNINVSTSANEEGAGTLQVGNNTAVPLETPNGDVSCMQVMIPVNDTCCSGNTSRLKVELPRCLCSLQSSSLKSRYGLDPATLPSVVSSIHFLLVHVFSQVTHSFT